MDTLEILLWLIYPYTVVAVVGMGLIWQIETPSERSEEKTIRKRAYLNRSILGMLFLCIITGACVVIFQSMSNEPEKLFNWVRSLVTLQPDLSIMRDLSMLSIIHFFLILTFLLMLSFTTYLNYITLPYNFIKNRYAKKVIEES